MNPRFTTRLLMDVATCALFLLCLAYWWQTNAVHEFSGTALFALLLLHNVWNRRWYAHPARKRPAPGRLDQLLLLCLLLSMSTMLVTSMLISQTVFAAIAPADAFLARRIHIAAAYWTLILVAIHIGTRWRTVLGATHRLRNLLPPTLLTVMALLLSGAGLYSSFVLGIGDKLLSSLSLDGWDFSQATLLFFLHHIAVLGLYAFIAHRAFERMRINRQR